MPGPVQDSSKGPIGDFELVPPWHKEEPIDMLADHERLTAKVAELEAALVATGRLEEQARAERDRAEADAAAMRAALQEIANHGLDLPAACCVTEEYQNGYSRGVVSQGAIARKALREAPNDL